MKSCDKRSPSVHSSVPWGCGSLLCRRCAEAGGGKEDAPDKDLILKGDAKCTGCHDEADEPQGRATMLELNPGVLAIATTTPRRQGRLAHAHLYRLPR